MQDFMHDARDPGKGTDVTVVAKNLMLWILFFALVFAVYWNVLGYLKEQIDLQKTNAHERVNQYTRAELEQQATPQDILTANVTPSANDAGRVVVVRIS